MLRGAFEAFDLLTLDGEGLRWALRAWCWGSVGGVLGEWGNGGVGGWGLDDSSSSQFVAVKRMPSDVCHQTYGRSYLIHRSRRFP